MAIIKGTLKTKSGDTLYPATSQDKVEGLSTVASTGSYNDLSNKPTIPTKTSDLTNDSGFITSSDIPTVNNATLTIQKNGTTVNTFTANASSNVTVNITVPTGVTLASDTTSTTSVAFFDGTVTGTTLTLTKKYMTASLINPNS